MAALIDGDMRRARTLFGDSLRVFHRLGEPGGTAEGLTGLAATDHPIRAATRAAAAERVRPSVGARQLPLDERTTGRHLDRARAHLSHQAWTEAWHTGKNLTTHDAIALALSPELTMT